MLIEWIIIIVLFVLCLILFWKNAQLSKENSIIKNNLKSEKESHKKGLNSQNPIIKGKAYEKVATLLSGFKYKPSNCRFLGNPIDYIIFNNLEDEKKDVEIILMDVKTGRAGLNKNQKRIEKACKEKRIKFEIFRITETEQGLNTELK
ncbi:MAG: hypothetical protein J7J93_01200 [Candidatus Aenigmarchaeota archaeon]|nr:hypothetical protein [Candidatus Aenigmarchaeota archaeon]